MNKKHIAILGAGIVGAGALILMSQEEPTYQPGGIGGVSKKEEATITTTETPVSPGDTIYNIVFPDPGFPDIPQAPITEPWWVTSLDPPPTTKKSAFTVPSALMPEGGITKGIAEAAVKAEESKKDLPPQFQWR